MSNSNCLEGIKCPECGYEDQFRIVALSTFLVTDDGTEEFGDVEWEEFSPIFCGNCSHSGKVKDFKTPPVLRKFQVKVVEQHYYYFDVKAKDEDEAREIAMLRMETKKPDDFETSDFSIEEVAEEVDHG